MQDTLTQFIAQYTGKPNVGDTPENTGQCVGLVEVWMDTLGLNTPHEYGNAKDLLANANTADFQVIQNTPDNCPVSGDIVVWDSSWGGGFGHTGICVSATMNSLSAFEQNDPTGHGPQVKAYAYTGVLGWLHPLSHPTSTASTAADLAACLAQHTQLVNACNAKDAQIAQQTQLITQLTADRDTARTEASTAQNQIATLQPVADQLPQMQTQLAQAQKDRSDALAAQESQNRIIAQLRSTSYTTATSSILINALLTRLANRLTGKAR